MKVSFIIAPPDGSNIGAGKQVLVRIIVLTTPIKYFTPRLHDKTAYSIIIVKSV